MPSFLDKSVEMQGKFVHFGQFAYFHIQIFGTFRQPFLSLQKTKNHENNHFFYLFIVITEAIPRYSIPRHPDSFREHPLFREHDLYECKLRVTICFFNHLIIERIKL